jgi:unsaturated rhamnogalacturonyl hydrolase
MAQSEMARQPSGYKVNSKVWDYVIGVELKGLEQLWRFTNDTAYYKYIKTTVDVAVNGSGVISGTGYTTAATLDNINEGKAINFLYSVTNDNRYMTAATTLRNKLKTYPRTSEGGFWHKVSYPYQMWLDGLYMASPFWAEYGQLFSEPSNYDSVVTQFVLMETHARDTVTSLLYHGWDEKKVSQWANPTTGCSPSFWGRALGWYAVALVDALDYFPSSHTVRAQLIAILQRLAVGIKNYQDPTYGTWYQVIDKGSLSDNWREASASCMFVYALAKGVRMGYLDSSYSEVAKKGYGGILAEFITMNSDSTINLTGICYTAGLDAAAGGVRDGSYNYYVTNANALPVSNDGKGTGPFIMASIELERVEFILPPLNFHSTLLGDSVSLTWTDKSYNAISFTIERRSESEASFSQIGEITKGVSVFVDRTLQGNTKYYYRANAKLSTDSSDYSAVDSIVTSAVTSINDQGHPTVSFVLQQNYPNPFNPTTQMKFSVKERGMTTLKVYDVLGREVTVLYHGYAEPGIMTAVQFDASRFTSGTYFSILKSGSQWTGKKMLLVK